MALLDDTGAVVEQYQWEPYGLLATLDSNADPRPPNSLGHQGLFFYRLNPQTGDTATLSTTAVGLYHNRNRWYSPSLGRFTSRDPNETAQLVVSAMLMNAETLSIAAGTFEAATHFADGPNLYAFGRANPVGARDPEGLISGSVMGTFDAMFSVGSICGAFAAAESLQSPDTVLKSVITFFATNAVEKWLSKYFARDRLLSWEVASGSRIPWWYNPAVSGAVGLVSGYYSTVNLYAIWALLGL